MSLNIEFLGRLDREIGSVLAHIAEAEASGSTLERDDGIQAMRARLAHLRETRRLLVDQSHGG